MSRLDAAAFQAARRGAFGSDLRLGGRVSSTQDQAREAALSGTLRGPAVFFAEEQTAGRGRWGRTWIAPEGSSLLFTAVFRVPDSPAPSSLPVVLGLASVLALKELGIGEAGLKWPNDLWWRGRKLGGLLVEQAGGWTLAGCGLNALQGENDWPPGLRGQAASLRQAGLRASREAVLAALLGSWESALGPWSRGGLAAFRAELDAMDLLKGRLCRAVKGRETLEGTAVGIADDGSLRLKGPGGEIRVVGAQALEVRPFAGGDGPNPGRG
jgi:BirA family biotin operon repressor/biotin-[acetyl-CoA-carboxylase] ligase